jgi:cell division septation protein DedD
MAPSYYVIELTARWLTILLVALALVMVLAFAFGYGAAWSVLGAHESGPEPAGLAAVTATPTPMEVVIGDPPEQPTARPVPTRPPTPTLLPPTATPEPVPTRATAESSEAFWVQVLASEHQDNIERARTRLAEAGFTKERQRVVTESTASGNELYRLRVGPFPDRPSAERVQQRVKASGFLDAWVVAP